MKYYDNEEKDLINSINQAVDDGVLQIASPSPVQREAFAQAARNTKKKKPITVRIMESDIRRLKAIAARKGMPYQTLVASVLHEYTHKTLDGVS